MSTETAADQARDVVADELERRGLEKEAVMGNNPTDSEFTGDKIPADGRSEKSELAADTVRETQSVKDRNADQEDHDMASPILAKDDALAKVSSLLSNVREIKPKLAEAYEEGGGMADMIPDEPGFEGGMEGMDEEPLIDEEVEEGEYVDLTPKETLQFALEDIQEAADAVLSIEDELVETSKRIQGARYSTKLAERCSSTIKLAEGYLGDARDSLDHLRHVTRKSPDGAGSTEGEIETQPQIVPHTPGAPGMSRASEDPFTETLTNARKLKASWDGMMDLFTRKAADKDDDAKPEEDKDMSKDTDKDASSRSGIQKDAAAYPPSNAEFTGDKQISPVPQEKELTHWHEGDARGDRDVSAEGGFDLNNIENRIELYEKIKVLTSMRERSEKNASESRWIVRGVNDAHLGDVTFADVTDEPSFTRENYAHFLSDEYGEGLRIAVGMYGDKCLQNGFASLTPIQRQTVTDFYELEKEQRVASDDRVKEAARNLVRAFESPEVPEKSKLISYFTDAFGDAEYARDLVNALLDTHTKLSTLVQRGLQYKEAYDQSQTRVANEVKVKRAADVAVKMAEVGLIPDPTRESIVAKTKELAKLSDEAFNALTSLVLAKTDEDFERHMEEGPESGITGNPLEGVRDPKSKITIDGLQPEVKTDAKIASRNVTEVDVRDFVKASQERGAVVGAGVVPQVTKTAVELIPSMGAGDLSFLQNHFTTTASKLTEKGVKPERHRGATYR